MHQTDSNHTQIAPSFQQRIADTDAVPGTLEKPQRAFHVFDRVPPGCRLHLQLNEMHAPHLCAGAWAVVDPADREFAIGELFLFRVDRCITWTLPPKPDRDVIFQIQGPFECGRIIYEKGEFNGPDERLYRQGWLNGNPWRLENMIVRGDGRTSGPDWPVGQAFASRYLIEHHIVGRVVGVYRVPRLSKADPAVKPVQSLPKKPNFRVCEVRTQTMPITVVCHEAANGEISEIARVAELLGVWLGAPAGGNFGRKWYASAYDAAAARLGKRHAQALADAFRRDWRPAITN